MSHSFTVRQELARMNGSHAAEVHPIPGGRGFIWLCTCGDTSKKIPTRNRAHVAATEHEATAHTVVP